MRRWFVFMKYNVISCKRQTGNQTEVKMVLGGTRLRSIHGMYWWIVSMYWWILSDLRARTDRSTGIWDMQ